MSAPPESRPAWYHTGMSAEDAAVWEAAERCAAQAPEIRPCDDAYLKLRPLLSGWLTEPVARPERGAA